MNFRIKSTLKSNHYHNVKHALKYFNIISNKKFKLLNEVQYTIL